MGETGELKKGGEEEEEEGAERVEGRGSRVGRGT